MATPAAVPSASQHPEVLQDALHERRAVSGIRDALEAEARVDAVVGADDAALVELVRGAMPAVLLLGGPRRRRADGPAAVIGLERRGGGLAADADLGLVDP